VWPVFRPAHAMDDNDPISSLNANGSTDSNNKNADAQTARVVPPRVAMQPARYPPPRRQSNTSSGGGPPTTAAQGHVGPSADTISNRTSLPSSSFLPITNPGMTTRRLNYQYDPAPAERYDMNTMPLGLHQPLTYMQQGYSQSRPGPDTPTYNGRPMDNAMGILSSEQYDDRGASRRSVRRQQEPMIPLFGLVEQHKEVVPVRKTAQVHKSQDAENGVGERRRKKQKLSSEDEGDEDAAKKARGRPRLDTKDETAADVSLTHISLFPAFSM
jgi:hypothetical protein